MVNKHGKKTIKWEGLSNFASRDVIIMCWEGNSKFATEAVARSYTTITCPWNLGVPWQEWSMYRCNASQLKRGDSVLGATLVACRNSRRGRTSPTSAISRAGRNAPGEPDNKVTVAGFAARFQRARRGRREVAGNTREAAYRG